MRINSQGNEVGLGGNILIRRNRMFRGNGEKQYCVCQGIHLCAHMHTHSSAVLHLMDRGRKSGNIIKLEKEGVMFMSLAYSPKVLGKLF